MKTSKISSISSSPSLLNLSPFLLCLDLLHSSNFFRQSSIFQALGRTSELMGTNPAPLYFLTLPVVGSWHSPRLWQWWAAGQSAYLHLIYSSLSSQSDLLMHRCPPWQQPSVEAFSGSLSLVHLPSFLKPRPEEPVLLQASATSRASPSWNVLPCLIHLSQLYLFFKVKFKCHLLKTLQI